MDSTTNSVVRLIDSYSAIFFNSALKYVTRENDKLVSIRSRKCGDNSLCE